MKSLARFFWRWLKIARRLPLTKTIAGPGFLLPPDKDTLVCPNYQPVCNSKQKDTLVCHPQPFTGREYKYATECSSKSVISSDQTPKGLILHLICCLACIWIFCKPMLMYGSFKVAS